MDVGFDINLVRALVLISLIVGFCGIWAWAWSRSRKREFDAMSQLPLEEDGGEIPETDNTIKRTKE